MSKLEYVPSEIAVQVFKHNDLSDEARMIAALRMGECRPPLEAPDDTVARVAFGSIDGVSPAAHDEAPEGFVSDVSFVWTAARRNNLPDTSPSPFSDFGQAATTYAHPLRLSEQFMLQQLIVGATNGVRRELAQVAASMDFEEADFYQGIQGRALNELAFFAAAPRLLAAQKYKTILAPVLNLLESRGVGPLDSADHNISGSMQVTARELMATAEWHLPTSDFFSLSKKSATKVARFVVAETACLAREAAKAYDETWLMRPVEVQDTRPALIYAPSSVVQRLMRKTQESARPSLWEAYRQGAYPFDPVSMLHRYRDNDRRQMWRPPVIGGSLRTAHRSWI